ncbi:Rossmann-like and DUF2520 domain-containing protein [Aquimarina pacifica]|uniref:Rossmann-like and DUF2520 domain-containing protein n=1 Tax=Aquimarina pacifica TaxID=1296415 RepID=UPI000470DCB4|nr:DUF2520 domain-containing protein [Aquimarina pacifica]
MIRVVLLGAGNVATHFYSAFYKEKTVEIIQCYNRKNIKLHPDQKEDLIITDLSDLKEADVYILAIHDDAIKEIANLLPFRNKFVVHTSGSVPIDVLGTNNRTGVLYPLQTFTKDTYVDFSTVPFCLEAENSNDLQTLKTLASSLSKKIFEISSAQRGILHVAAVFVNNFVNHMFAIGNDICKEHQVPFEILHPLILETAQKVSLTDPDSIQTGPAVRNDTKTIERHLNILKEKSQKNIYQLLTTAIQDKHGKKL